MGLSHGWRGQGGKAGITTSKATARGRTTPLPPPGSPVPHRIWAALLRVDRQAGQCPVHWWGARGSESKEVTCLQMCRPGTQTRLATPRLPALSQKRKVWPQDPAIPLLSIYPKEIKTCLHRICVALLTTAKREKQPTGHQLTDG